MKKIFIAFLAIHGMILSIPKSNKVSVVNESKSSVVVNTNTVVPSQHKAEIIATVKSLQKTYNENDLHYAILNDSANEIENCIKNGVSVNLGKDGKPPLLWAVILKKTVAVEILLKHGASVNISYAGKPIVHHAITLNNFKVATLLIRYGAEFKGNIESCHNNVMGQAIKFQALELIQELIDHGWNIHEKKCYFVGNSSSEKLTNVWWETMMWGGASESTLKLFIKNGANVNQVINCESYFPTPLLLAVRKGGLKVIGILLEAGANINQSGGPDNGCGTHTPLSYAISLGHDKTVDFLIANGASL